MDPEAESLETRSVSEDQTRDAQNQSLSTDDSFILLFFYFLLVYIKYSYLADLVCRVPVMGLGNFAGQSA